MIRAALVAAVLAPAAPAHAKPRLHRCGGAVCGSVPRPLDPAKPRGRKLQIGFKLFRVARPKGPTIVAVEGGPGYPSIGSQVEYRGIYAPLLRERNLLLVDNRGTGQSGLIDCENLQTFAGRTSGSAFAKRVGDCASQIDGRFGAHATDLFATAFATYLVRGAACGRVVIRSFTRGALDSSCTAGIPPIHAPDFQATDPAQIAANALADAAIRSFYSDSRAGLRGGRFTVKGDRITLRDVVFAPGSKVSGTGRFDYARGIYSGKFTVNGVAVTVPPTPL